MIIAESSREGTLRHHGRSRIGRSRSAAVLLGWNHAAQPLTRLPDAQTRPIRVILMPTQHSAAGAS